MPALAMPPLPAMAREESSSAKKVQPKTSRVECKKSAKGFADNLIDFIVELLFLTQFFIRISAASS